MAALLEIHCSGTPYEIGFKHGQTAKKQVLGTLEYYEEYFQRHSKMNWDLAVEAAGNFLPYLKEEWPHLVEEMQGLADGAGLPFLSVLALNARTEISMGMMDDGCTSLAWQIGDVCFAGQNWDWEDAQKKNLIALHIKRSNGPHISQITEAGILGKIGLNSAGVGICLNALRVKGVKFDRLPAHLALRVAMEASSRAEAVSTIERTGTGSAIHILVADSTGATSLECSALDAIRLEMVNGKIAHSNHFLVRHASGVKDTIFLADSRSRMARISELLKAAGTDVEELTAKEVSKSVQRMLEDEDNYPTSINRKSSPGNTSSTLFSIVMDLNLKTAVVKVGRPTAPDGIAILKPFAL